MIRGYRVRDDSRIYSSVTLNGISTPFIGYSCCLVFTQTATPPFSDDARRTSVAGENTMIKISNKLAIGPTLQTIVIV